MKGSHSLVLFALLAAVLGGCADAPAATKGQESVSTSAAPAVAGDEFGSITGLVVDPEEAPISGATVSLVEAALQTKTDAAGRFTFNNLTAGTHSIIVERIGYEQVGKKVDVVAGEVVEARFVLAAFIVTEDPYVLTVPRSAYINFGFYALDTVQRTVNDSNINGITCADCKMVAHYPAKPLALILEGLWSRSAAVPAVNEQIDIDWNVPNGNGWSYYTTGLMKSRQRVDATEAMVKEYAKHDRLMLEVGAALGGGVMVQQKMEFFFSFAYGAAIPDDFTALPPA